MMKNNKISILRAIVLAVGLIFVGLGVYFDGFKAVIANAIALCMSCIGLG